MQAAKVFSKRNVWIFSLLAVFLVGAVVVAVLYCYNPAPESLVFSGSVQQLADGVYLANSAPRGESVCFTGAWFDRAVGSTVTGITVTALPAATEGVLKIGYADVEVGEFVPRETLSYLSFLPHNGVTGSSFSFVPEAEGVASPYLLTCQLRVTDAVNCCPVGTKSVTAVSTHQSIVCTGVLGAEDPDGDALFFEVVSYPLHGTLVLDRKTGSFVYTPDGEAVGEDRFVWRVQDENGGYSEDVTVTVTVREDRLGYVYEDMLGNAYHTDALAVSEAGILVGERVGDRHYFHPDKAITRAAFLTVLLRAAGIEVPQLDKTDFADDADIPRGMKGAVQYAKEQGFLDAGDRFRPNDPITRAEAAGIAAKVLSLTAPGYYETVEDFDTIPVDAADALYALYEGGYIGTSAEGNLLPLGELTRAAAAKCIARVLAIKGA